MKLEEIEIDLQYDGFKKLMADLCYEKFGEGDRHGSREVTWSKISKNGSGDKIDRFVVLAATPEDSTPQYAVEVWAGADDGKGFARFLVASFEGVKPGELTKEDLLARVEAALQGATERANNMTGDDLINRHVTTARIRETRSLWNPREQAR